MKENSNEIWKDIKEYEGIYQVSNLGRVKSLSRFHKTDERYSLIGYTSKERILKPGTDGWGYLYVALSKDKKRKNKRIHRLVAETFIPNIKNLQQVNHIDGNKKNNKVDNLEWCTYGHNEKEAYRLGLKQSRIKGKPLYQCDLNGNIIKKWNSINEIAKAMNYSSGTICSCCNKKRNKTYKGFIWRYVNE